MFSLMPAASYDDGLLDFEIIDTTGGILGWANLFGDVVHQTIIGKPEQNPLSTNSTIEQVQASVPKSHWKSRPKRRWTATCYRRPNIFVSQWIIAR